MASFFGILKGPGLASFGGLPLDYHEWILDDCCSSCPVQPPELLFKNGTYFTNVVEEKDSTSFFDHTPMQTNLPPFFERKFLFQT